MILARFAIYLAHAIIGKIIVSWGEVTNYLSIMINKSNYSVSFQCFL